jgi:nicotinate dehydrogenase subunit B
MSKTEITPQPTVEIERYELREGAQHLFEVDRRAFFKIFGAGLVVCAAVPAEVAAQQGESGRGRSGDRMPEQISAWLHIAESGAITVYTGKAEMGQNIRTSLAQQVAEELRVKLDAISLLMADTAQTPFDMGTFGSRTTPQMGTQLRRMATGAREVLLQRAVQMFSGNTSAQANLPQGASPAAVDISNLTAEDGRVIDRRSGRSLSYAELVRGQKLFECVVADPQVTPPAEWKIAGRQFPPKVNGRDFVTGRHQYPSDIRRPGMMHGKVVRPSAFNATLVSADTTAAEQSPKVNVVRDGSFIGVTAPTPFAAEQAAEKIKAEWKAPQQPSNAELFTVLKQAGGETGGQGAGPSPHVAGSVEQGLASAAHKLSATYTVQYIAHAPLEPRATVAEWSSDGTLTVWTGSQRPFGVRDDLMQAFHLPPEKVRVIVPDTGSAYGGKHTGECAVEAARLAKAAGKPVKLVWTREEEFTWAYFRPAGVMEVRGGVDAKGKLIAWEFHNYNSGPAGIGTPYSCPNQHVEFHPANSPLRQGSYRALAATANHFAREGMMNELALVSQIDRLEFRLRNLAKSETSNNDSADATNGAQFDPERLRAVFNAAAQQFGWGKQKAGGGLGFGVAGGFEKGGYVACMAEVHLDMSKDISPVKIGRVVEAFDCGPVVNVEGLRNQIAGAIAQGIGGALFESIQFANGRILNPHFAQYRLPRFADMPAQIEVVLVDRKDKPPFGAGETPIVGIAPALADAIYQASGFVRLRALPLAPNGVNCGCVLPPGKS